MSLLGDQQDSDTQPEGRHSDTAPDRDGPSRANSWSAWHPDPSQPPSSPETPPVQSLFLDPDSGLPRLTLDPRSLSPGIFGCLSETASEAGSGPPSIGAAPTSQAAPSRSPGLFGHMTTTETDLGPPALGVTPTSQAVQYFAGAHGFAIGTVVSGDYHVHYSQPSEVERPGPSRGEIITIAKWLSSVNYWTYHDAAVARRAPNTGSWFLKSEEFLAWVKSEHPRSSLWAVGMPGAGKSILSSTVVDDLRGKYSKDHQTAVLFAYCRYKDNCTVGDILRSFLKQLLEMRYMAYHAIRPVYDRYTVRQTQLPDAEAEAVLHRVLLLFERSYVVIDGLDEVSVDVKSKLLAILGRLPTKALLFSRPVVAANQIVSGRSTRVVVTAQPQDLGTFVSDTIAGHARLNQICTRAIAAQIRRKVVEQSKGMFLVAALQLAALKGCVNPATLQSTLETLPDGVDDMYRNTLQRIEGQVEAESDLAKRTLVWLARSKRPLKVYELQEALATSFESGEYDILSVTPLDVILNVCCGLVVVNPANQEISLIHYTAHKFLLQLQSLPFSNHAVMITGTCITTLAIYGFMEQEFHDLRALAVFLSRAAFLPYAFRYWMKHASDVDSEEKAWHTNFALLEAIKSFEHSSRLPCVACDGEYEESLFHHRSQGLPSQRTSPRLDLHTAFQLATCSGLTRLLGLLPFDDSPTPLSGSTSLLLALKHGHEGMVQVLVETFPTLDVNAQDFSGRSSLHLAIRRADLATVRLLLNHPIVNVNSRDKSEAAPIWEAVCVGDQPILDSLLQHPLIDVNVGRGERLPMAKDDDFAIQIARTDKYAGGITPLIFSVLCNKETVTATLLRHPTIDPNLCDSDGLSPLLAAIGVTNGGPQGEVVKQFTLASPPSLPNRSVNGSARMAELVLRHPSTNVNIRAGFGAAFTPLMLASMGGRSDIIEVLLSHRNIDVNASGQQFQTALSWVGQAFRELSELASAHGGAAPSPKQYSFGVLAVQRILSHPQLDPDLICDSEGTTPLMVACMLGLDAMVQTLLSAPRRSTSPSSWTTAGPISTLFSGISSMFRSVVVSKNYQEDGLASHPSTGKLTASQSNAPRLRGPRLKAGENHPHARSTNSTIERINEVDSQKRSPLLLALSPLSGNIQATVEALLAHPSIDVNQQDVDGNTALMIACQRNLVSVVQLLLSRDGAEINSCNRQGRNALMSAAACRLGDPTEIIRLLLLNPGLQNVNKGDIKQRSSLHLAVESAANPSASPSNAAACIQLASSNLVDVNLRNGAGDTPLHLASYHGLSDVAAALLRRPDIDVGLPDRQGSRAIHIACERRHWPVVRNLLQHQDINLHVPNESGNKPIHIATERGDEETILGLLRHPSIDVNAMNDHGYAAIHIASRLACENAAAMRALLKHPSIDVNLRDREGYAAVDILCKFPNIAALTLLLRHPRIEPNALHHHRSFYSACWRHIYGGVASKSRQAKIDMRRIQHFLRYDPGCIEFTDTKGTTILHHAAKQGCDDLVALIMRGAWDACPEVHVTLLDTFGKSALEYAVEAGHHTSAHELSLGPPPLGSLFEVVSN